MEESPQQLAQERVRISREYAQKMKELGGLRKLKALKVLELKSQGIKSMAEAERRWEGTEEGQREIEISHYCKGLEMIISSLNTHIKIKIGEGYNQF